MFACIGLTPSITRHQNLAQSASQFMTYQIFLTAWKTNVLDLYYTKVGKYTKGNALCDQERVQPALLEFERKRPCWHRARAGKLKIIGIKESNHWWYDKSRALQIEQRNTNNWKCPENEVKFSYQHQILTDIDIDLIHWFQLFWVFPP